MKSILKQLQENEAQKKSSSSESKQQAAQPVAVTYDKEKLLGKGSYGEVCKGTMHLTDGTAQEVAVKTVSYEDDFEKEMENFKILRSLPFSPYLVQSYESNDVREKNSNVLTENAIVMEYVPYGSLYNFINNEKGSLTPAESYQVVSGIANGIDFLHDYGLIHRDIKIDNVLLSAKKEPKIADFGNMEQEEKNCPNICTTPSYAAPETIPGKKSITKAADVFSFGMTLFEIVADEEPFKGYKGNFAVMTAIVHGKRPTIPETCSAEMKALITNCWQQSPSSRPTMKEAIKQIEKIGGSKKELLDCKMFQRMRK